ncbi:MAG: alginate lyase family protein, partial [Pseudomonadota bacterium]
NDRAPTRQNRARKVAMIDDPDLLDKGEARLQIALLEQMRPDGSFPLEARRGARAIWYHRQSLASLTTILAALRYAGREPLKSPELADAWERTLTYFTDSVRWPRLVKHYAAENYIPGPLDDYRRQDLGFLDQRGHGRHYLAWVESAVSMTDDPTVRARLRTMLDLHAVDERPLIDDFSGGAVTCFSWSPDRDADLSDAPAAVTQ